MTCPASNRADSLAANLMRSCKYVDKWNKH